MSRQSAHCPICQEPLTAPTKDPFCSKRCADVDLHRWLNGRYAIPDRTLSAEEVEEADLHDDGDALFKTTSYLN